MKYSKQIISIIFLSFTFCVSEAGAVFLLINPGPEAQGTGEAQAAKADDAYATHYNPAGLGFVKHDEIAFQHVNWLPNLANDLFYDFIGFTKNSGNLGTFGGHLIYLNLGEQTETNSNEDVLGTFKSYMMAVTFSYGTTLTANSSIGMGFKVHHQRLADHGVSGEGKSSRDDGASSDFAFDIGYLQKFGDKKQHAFGVSVQNIGPPIDFVDADQADPHPTNMKLGLYYQLYETETTTLSFLFDMNKLLVGAYPSMDWNGDGIIAGEDEYAHKDDWYKGVFTAWLDDWYYGGDYDFDPPSNYDYRIEEDFWRNEDKFADGIIGGFVKSNGWDYVKHETLSDNNASTINAHHPDFNSTLYNPYYYPGLANLTQDNNFSSSFGTHIGNSHLDEDDWDVELMSGDFHYSHIPNYAGFCDEKHRGLYGYHVDGTGNLIYDRTNAISMCYDENGVNYRPDGDYADGVSYGQHTFIDMPQDGFGSADVFDAQCDENNRYDCTYMEVVDITYVTQCDNDGDGVADAGAAGCTVNDADDGIHIVGYNFNPVDYVLPEGTFNVELDGVIVDNLITNWSELADIPCFDSENELLTTWDHDNDSYAPELPVWSNTGGGGYYDSNNISTPEVSQYCNNTADFGSENLNVLRLDVPYIGEHSFKSSDYGYYNPFGVKEKGSGDDREFKDELEEMIYNFGFEYKYTDNFFFRAGFIYDLEGDIKNPTVGAGLLFNKYGFDFAYTAGDSGHPRANTMFFAITIGV